MWTYEHSIDLDTGAQATAIWRLWADVDNWGSWNRDIERIEIVGPFAVGAEITMTPAGQDPIRLRVVELIEGELFVDEATIDGLTLCTMHHLARTGGNHARVVYRMEVTGPGADRIGPQIGPAITADWPDTMAALVALAASTPPAPPDAAAAPTRR